MKARRLSDALDEIEVLLVDLVWLHGRPESYESTQQRRIADLHRRLGEVEHELRRRASELGEDPRASLGELRRQLEQHAERRRHTDPGYSGPERRKHNRRSGVGAGSFKP